MRQGAQSTHPDLAALHKFALGRLARTEMRRVERHLGECEVCLQAALTAPPDHLVRLLASREVDRVTSKS